MRCFQSTSSHHAPPTKRDRFPLIDEHDRYLLPSTMNDLLEARVIAGTWSRRTRASSSSSSSCTVSRRGTKRQIRFPREHVHRPGPPGFLEDRGTTFERSPIHVQDRNRSGKKWRVARFTPRSRAALSTRWTRVHAISRAGKWRNVRNKTLAAGQRSGRWLRAGPPASVLWGQWTGPHRVASRVEESPCVSRSHTRHTHAARSSPSSLPCTPTTAASIILLSWPLGPFYSHRASSLRD